MAKSKNDESIIELDKFLERAAKQKNMPPGLAKFKDSEQKSRQRLAASGIGKLEGYDLYIPVEAHRAKWKGGKDFLIASSPLGPEEDIDQIVAYQVWDGKRVVLDANVPPEMPVLVLVPEEHESHKVVAAPKPPKGVKPLAPPGTKEEEKRKMRMPTGDEPPISDGNSYMQFSHIWIYDDKEPWTKGKPEIYIIYIDQRYTNKLDIRRKNLSWVDKERQWYWTGYTLNFPFDSIASNHTGVMVYESDGLAWYEHLLFGIVDIFLPVPIIRSTMSYAYSQMLIAPHDDILGRREIYKTWYPWGYAYRRLYVQDALLVVNRIH